MQCASLGYEKPKTAKASRRYSISGWSFFLLGVSACLNMVIVPSYDFYICNAKHLLANRPMQPYVHTQIDIHSQHSHSAHNISHNSPHIHSVFARSFPLSTGRCKRWPTKLRRETSSSIYWPSCYT